MTSPKYPFVILQDGVPITEFFYDGSVCVVAFKTLEDARKFCLRNSNYSVAELVPR